MRRITHIDLMLRFEIEVYNYTFTALALGKGRRDNIHLKTT